MTRKSRTRKRPCSICRRWFTPNPKQGSRQVTCGRPACQRERHRKKCAEWNRKNPEYFKADYLHKKLLQTTSPSSDKQNTLPCKGPPPARGLNSGIPHDEIEGVLSSAQVVAIEYIVTQLLRSKKSSANPLTVPDTG